MGKLAHTNRNHYQKILRHHQNRVFGNAKYMVNKASQERLRLPSRLPAKEDLKFKELHITTDEITQRVSAEIFSRADFIEPHKLVCSCLTLFNGRRGREPVRVKVRQWLERGK